jgi:NADH-quinone oxidoreductase subunit G
MRVLCMPDTAEATPAEAPPKTTLTVTIDGTPIEAKPGELLIAAAERTGTYIPRFCWHPRMSSVGMCRQCLVEVDGPRGPALTVSCMQPVAEGMVVHTQSDTVKKAQEGVLEFLLINHPLDCPVCDKGGECPLQDQAVSHGPGESRFVEEKRHYEKPIPISDVVFLDRERCILCDRCTRFAKEVAGDPLIHFISRGNDTQVQTFPDEPFSSYFSGNTVQICPVGALTAKPYRFKARPWDLDQVESTCTTCAVGCRTVVQSSRDELLRYQGVDADPVNWGWLCDKGRFGFEAVNSDARLTGPMIRQGDALAATSWTKALDAAAGAIRRTLTERGPGHVAVIGGARGTNEDAAAWAKLAKDVIGTAHVDAQLDDGLPAALVMGLPRATIDQAAAAKTVLLLCGDLKEELPVLHLRLRDSASKRRSRIVELSTTGSGLTELAYRSIRFRAGEEAALVHALIANGSAAAVGVDESDLAAIREQIASGTMVVVLGRPSLASDAAYTTEAAMALHQAYPEARFLTTLRRGNVLGALAAGLTPSNGGKGTREILQAAAAGHIGVLVLLGADPLADFPDAQLAAQALAGADTVISIDTYISASTARAHVVLAAAAYGEKGGTTTNLEGRVSRLAQKVTVAGTARADWLLAAELSDRLGSDLAIGSISDAWSALCASNPAFAALPEQLGDGVVADLTAALPTLTALEIPVAGGYTLRLATSRKLYDAGTQLAASPSMSGLAAGTQVHLNPYDYDRLAPGTSVKVSTDRAAVVVPAVSNPQIARGSAWMAYNQPDAAVSSLIDSGSMVTEVRVETLR